MAPLSARGRHGEDAAAVVARLQAAGGGKLNFTAVQEVALTPRGPAATPRSQLTTPRPLVRGPLAGAIGRQAMSVELLPEEEAKVERVFAAHDSAGQGEIDMMHFNAMCEALEFPLEHIVAKNWLSGRPKDVGLSVQDLKQLYAQILQAQSPAVRQAVNRKPLRLREVLGAESNMRNAFAKFSREDGKMHSDDIPEVLVYLGFPDVFGDRFDRFVSEWADLRGGSGQVNFHDFVGCMNLLVEFSERQLESERSEALAPTH